MGEETDFDDDTLCSEMFAKWLEDGREKLTNQSTKEPLDVNALYGVFKAGWAAHKAADVWE